MPRRLIIETKAFPGGYISTDLESAVTPGDEICVVDLEVRPGLRSIAMVLADNVQTPRGELRKKLAEVYGEDSVSGPRERRG